MLSDDCILFMWCCDGYLDCFDFSDEFGCGINEIFLKGDVIIMGFFVILESVIFVGNNVMFFFVGD